MDNRQTAPYILIVDDFAPNLRLLTRMLTGQGYQVKSLEDGRQALTLIRARLPDLVLLDIMMPEINGFEICAQLKAEETTHDIPVIFISAQADIGDKVKAFSVGGVDYITKPFEVREVLARVKTHLDLRDLQKQLEAQNTQLQQEIADRKRAEAALQQAKKAAEAASQAKTKFLANMSHELRTPLNSVLGYAQILQGDTMLSVSHQEMISTIRSSGEHLLALINDVLDLSKIEAGHMELFPTEFYLADFLQRIVDMFRLRAIEKEIVFRYEPQPPLPYRIKTDAKMLRQILLNLLSNAVKFTEQGGINFKVSLSPSEQVKLENEFAGEVNPGSRRSACAIRFEVEDTGIGIAAEDLTKIFEPFRQVGIQARYAEGTGLGLAISQHQAKMMGSYLNVQSTVGQGSRFWFDLEVEALGPLENSILGTTPKSTEKIVGFKGDPPRILVVDDSIVNRNMLTTVLIRLGFEVIEAVDGLDGLEKVGQARPDLALIDIVMPNLDGVEMTRRVRQTTPSKELPIIAISASAYQETQSECLAAGCDDFLFKPVKIDRLLSLLEKHLELEWVYADKDEGSDTPKADSTEMVLPPIETITLLHNLALDGDVGGLLENLSAIEQTDEQLQPFVAKLRQPVKQYQLDSLCEFLEQLL